MRTSFKVHAVLAGGTSALMLLVAGLTLLPGSLPLPSPRLLALLAGATVLPLLGWAFVRGLFGGFDRTAQWPAFRCLPGPTQLALVALLGAGVVLCVLDGGASGSRQNAEVRDGRYVVFETTPGRRGTVEVDRREYEAVREADQRGALTIPGTMLAGAALIALVTGEVRRADDEAVKACVKAVKAVSTTSAAPASGGTRS
ncbi:hypothetical protein ACOZE3_14815 [Streptomyces cinereoruber]|uniref:hypothetical protein n=1 Tax=Streptomyces cinereoruber TaxID=67260 RepID=UPI003BF57162